MKMNLFNKKQKISGYSFIELIIYSTLVTMIVGEFLLSTQLLTESSRKDKERHAVLESERFLSQKLDWLLFGVGANKIWVIGSILYVQRPNGNYYALYRSGNAVMLATAINTDSDPEPETYSQERRLTGNHVSVTSELATVQTVNGQSVLRIQATLQAQNETINLDKLIYPR
jgi:hypothetical protein